MSKEVKRVIPFDDILAALLDDNRSFPPAFLHRFSDLNPTDFAKLKTVWGQVSPARRVALVEDLEILAETNTLVSFDDLCVFCLDDSEPGVRIAALRYLWESEDVSLVARLIHLLENDPVDLVRAAAASTLGKFVYLGELEEIPPSVLLTIEEKLLGAASDDQPPLIRRRAIESLGYSSRKEVKHLIQSAYNHDDPQWQCTALFAMGRSANEEYIPTVVDQLDNPNLDVQFEAVRAAGELSASQAREPLLEMLAENADDGDLRMAVIWSLSQIGGEEVRETLETLLEETDDDEQVEFIQEALDNLYLTEGLSSFEMFDFDSQDEDDLRSVVNLEDKSEDEEEDNSQDNHHLK
ncbi:MAG: HEAT repeat domain-containing protein [Chloroflexota bacterium]|jgi:HEAT repeat protein